MTEGGWGLDGIWSDDFHHELRRYLVGDFEGAFRDFRGSLADLVVTINRGWLFCGEYSIHRGYCRGTDPAGLSPRSFRSYIQNHDRIGNRALGERLDHQVEPAVYRAASALFLATAATPLLFMGQEWAASAPFVFFTDHPEELGRLVHAGRMHEFRDYAAFVDPARRLTIPHCQDEQNLPRLQDRLVGTAARTARGDVAAVPGSLEAAANGTRPAVRPGGEFPGRLARPRLAGIAARCRGWPVGLGRHPVQGNRDGLAGRSCRGSRPALGGDSDDGRSRVRHGGSAATNSSLAASPRSSSSRGRRPCCCGTFLNKDAMPGRRGYSAALRRNPRSGGRCWSS